MSDYESVAVPFCHRGNRQYLTREQLEEAPWLIEFVAGFSNCFEPDYYSEVLWFCPDGDARPPVKYYGSRLHF